MAHPYTFFERFGYMGTCVLPAEVLDDTPLTDPETGLPQLSLRQRCSQNGQLCYARVLSRFADGLYWAEVAATPELADAERLVLTELDLTSALAWDERLTWRDPAEIRRFMQAHARDLAPLRPCKEPVPPTDLLPDPEVPLTVVATVDVSAEDLRDALETDQTDPLLEGPQHAGKRQLGTRAVQQGLLRALYRSLQHRLTTTSDLHTAQALQALSVLVARVQGWQRETRQRLVNAVWEWRAESRRLAWSLILGAPETLLPAGNTPRVLGSMWGA